MAEKTKTLKEARKLLETNLNNGKALAKFKSFIKNQSGDETVINDQTRLLQAKYTFDLKAHSSGYLKEIMANELGKIAMTLGAGREQKESIINLGVGIVLHKKVGDFIESGESILEIHSDTENIEEIKARLYKSIVISNEKVNKLPLIFQTINK